MAETIKRWRQVLCAAGEGPRKVLFVYHDATYYDAVSRLKTTLRAKALMLARYVDPVTHEASSDDWTVAETVRVQPHTPALLSPVWQLEYGAAADVPADLFHVPRPPRMCWRCDRKIGVVRGYCPECQDHRRRAYNAWIQHHHRLRRRAAQQ